MIGPYSWPASFRFASGWRMGFDPAVRSIEYASG
jgi:hypothetical protein